MVQEDDTWEGQLRREHTLAPFRDPALRAYLDDLRSLLNQGFEGGWFVADQNGLRRAVGKTEEGAHANFAAVNIGIKPALVVRIDSIDIVRHHNYYLWQEQHRNSAKHSGASPEP